MRITYFPFLVGLLLGLGGVFLSAQAQDKPAQAEAPALAGSRPEAVQPRLVPYPRIRVPGRRMSFREVYPTRRSNAPVQRFETMEGAPSFILDNTGSRALFQYERGGEVLVLTPVHTTRGDTLYKNDQGMVVLRLRRVGSATLFPRPRSHGVVAWTTGSAQQLGPPKVSMEQMTRILTNIADDLARALDHDFSITVTGASEETAWIYLDAANNVRASVLRVQRIVPTSDPMSEITKLKIVAGDQPAGFIQSNELQVQVTPKLGFSGRLSSLKLQTLILNDDAAAAETGLPEYLAEFSVMSPVEVDAEVETTAVTVPQ
jgi:hypothetical protein